MLKGLTQFYPLTRPFERREYRNVCIFYVRKQYRRGNIVLEGLLLPVAAVRAISVYLRVSLVFSVSKAAGIPPLRNHLYLPRRQGLILSVLLLAAALGGVCHSDENMPEPGT